MGDPPDRDLDEVLTLIAQVAQLRADAPPPRGPADPPRDRQIPGVTRAARLAESSVPSDGGQVRSRATIRCDGSQPVAG